MSKRVIITAGGTGGHIFPAIAIGKSLLKSDSTIEILFVGATGGMEMTLVPKYNFRIKGVTVSGLMRKITLRNVVRNLAFPFKLLIGLRQAKNIVREFNPDIVIGVGGYASGPVGKVATRMNIPLVICEANAYPGMTNKLLAPKAAKILLGDEAALKFFDKAKTIVTGNPIREDLSSGIRENGLKAFGLDASKKTILSLGGSLGAGTINAAIEKNLNLLKSGDLQLIWQCGKRYHEELSSRVNVGQHVKLLPFIDNMPDAFAAADLVISRAGASTIAELIQLGMPSILVPSPNVAEDHQTKNAMSLVSKSASMLVKDIDASERLIAEAIALVKDENRLREMKSNIDKIEKHDAAKEIAAEILELIKK